MSVYRRYWLFMGDTYYPSGGMRDLQRTTDTVEEAVKIAKAEADSNFTWWHVFDSYKATVVAGVVTPTSGKVRPFDPDEDLHHE